MGYESDPLFSYSWIRNRSYTIIFKIKSSPGYSTSFPTSWFHHLMNLRDPIIYFDPVNSSYMWWLIMFTPMVDCRLWIYYLRFQRPATSRDYSTGGHSHLPYPACRSIFPIISLATWWWKPSITVNIVTSIIQTSLLYRNTIWTTAFYIISHARIVAPSFVSIFATITHLRQEFLRFWYRFAQSLLFYETVRTRYGKVVVGSIVSEFTLMATILDSKQYCRVSRHLHHSSPILHLSELYR